MVRVDLSSSAEERDATKACSKEIQQPFSEFLPISVCHSL